MEGTILIGVITNEQREEKAREYLSELAFLTITAGGHVHEHENDGSMRTEGNTPHRAAPTRVDPTVDAGRRGTSTRGDDEGGGAPRTRVDAFVVRFVRRHGGHVVRRVRARGGDGDERVERVHVLHGVREDFRRASGVQRRGDVHEERERGVDTRWTVRGRTRRRPGGDSSDEGWTRVRGAGGLAREDAVPRTTGD